MMFKTIAFLLALTAATDGRPVAKRHFISGKQTWPASARERKISDMRYDNGYSLKKILQAPL